MEYFTIDFNGKTFKYQEVYHVMAGKNVLIGENSLEDELVNEDGSYTSEYAKSIDEHFYGFVNGDLFNEITLSDFEKYVNKNLD